MTIEQAIEHAEEVANSYNDTVPECECAAEHRQLAAWLRELQERRKEQYLTIEQIAAVVGSQTIHSAWFWLDFARTLEILGYAVVKRRTDADD